MPNWKKVLVSGSNATLNHITASGNISSSGHISASFFSGDGSQLKNLPSSGGSVFETGSAPQNTPSIKPIAGLNSSSGTFSSVLGGKRNHSKANGSSIVGGCYNFITKSFNSTIAGGYYNNISEVGNYGGNNFIGGGCYNTMQGSGMGNNFIGGGYYNCVVSSTNRIGNTTIAGGSYNHINGTGGGNLYWATIVGGYYNCIYKNSNGSIIVGGLQNQISSSGCATIGGGKLNYIHEVVDGTIGGGDRNTLNSQNFVYHEGLSNEGSSNIAGGTCNSITNMLSSVGGGKCNQVSGSHSNIGGGFRNTIIDGITSNDGGETSSPLPANYSSILGGMCNQISSPGSNIIGGCSNQIHNSCCSTIGGGISNCIHAVSAVDYAHLNTIGGGRSNLISGSSCSNIVGGYNNTICLTGNGANNIIVGGEYNYIQGANSSNNTINGGYLNRIKSDYHYTAYSTIAGGSYNWIDNTGGNQLSYATVGGGNNNRIYKNSNGSTIAGGKENCISSSMGSTIAGGLINYIRDSRKSTIGGGMDNVINNDNFKPIEGQTQPSGSSNIAGGKCNSITNVFSFIGGGVNNQVSGSWSVIGGGCGNIISGSSLSVGQTTYGCFQTIAGGENNKITGNSSHNFIGSGKNNLISQRIYLSFGGSTYSNIVGGKGNTITGSADSAYHSIVGGRNNCIEGDNYGSFIGGGISNRITGDDSAKTIVGGEFNYNSGRYATIAGGTGNCITGYNSTLVGGYSNVARGHGDTISGGKYNLNKGNYSVIAGGMDNVIFNSSFNDSYNSILGGYCNHIIGEGYVEGAHKGNSILGGYCNNVSASVGGEIDVCNNIIGGRNNKIHNAQDSGILGGKNNCITHDNSFTVGSSICTTSDDTLFVNNICLYGTNGANGQILGGANIVLAEGTFGTATTIINDNISSSGYLKMEGAITASTDISSSGTIQGNHLRSNSLTSGNVVLAGTNGRLEDTTDFTYNTSNKLLSAPTASFNHLIVSQVISSSVINTSGSNIFGDEATDTQTLNGSVILGNITSATETDALFINGSNTIKKRTLQANAFTSTTIPVIASTSVTDLNDVTSAGSGIIITAAERTAIGTNTTDISTNTSDISTNTSDISTNTTNISGKLAKASNLSDLNNATTARTNIGLGNVDNKSSSTIRGEITSANIPNNAADTTGTAAKATILENTRTINGVDFNGSADITTVEGNTSGTGAGGTLNMITIGTTEYSVATGTGNGNVETSGTPVNDDYAKFTDSNTIEGRSTLEVKTDLSLNNVDNKSSSTIRGEITSTNVTTALGFTPTANTGTITSVTGTSPIASSGGTTPAISISAATNAAAGSMSATDKGKIDNITITSAVNLNTMDSSISSNTSNISTINSTLSEKAGNGANVDITSLTGLTTALSVAQGGTGATALDEIPLSEFDDDLSYVALSGAQTISGTKTFSVSQKFATGTVSTPSISFNSNNTYTTGFYLSNPHEISIARSGVQNFKFDSNGFQSLNTGTSNFAGDMVISSHLQAHCLGIGTTASTTQGEIRATGDIIANYSSDKRLKENIKPISGALDKLLQISGVTFDWIEKEEVHSHKGHDVGVIAQEVEEVLPEVVVTRDNGYKAVNYEKIVPLLIESIKDLKAEIDELKKSK